MSNCYFQPDGANVSDIDDEGNNTWYFAWWTYGGVRPGISFKSGTVYEYDDGSKSNPYIVE